MSIKTWKKIITLTVIAILLILTALTLFFGIGYFRYEKKLSAPTVIDMAEYGYQSAEDMEAFFQQLEKAASDPTLEYQSEYPELYADCDFDFAETEASQKICYLTFDDGPNSEVTPQVLDTLKEYGIKATFFVIYRDGGAEKALYKRIVEEGHTIAVHTASHNYKKILLCHDGPGHQNTAKALPDIIEGLMEQGYSFAALDNSVAPICFGY